MSQKENIDWLFEYMLQYITSSTFNSILKDFVETNCIYFDGGEENSFEHTKLHNEFKKTIDNLLETMLVDLGANEHQFVLAAKKGLRCPETKKYFEQLIANENFLYFKNMMVRKNLEIQNQAYNLFKQNMAKNIGINMNELQQLENKDEKLKKEREKKEKDDYKAMLEMSKALEEVKKDFDSKEDDDELKKALKLSEDYHKQQLLELENDIDKAIRISKEEDLKNQLKNTDIDDELKQAIHMSLKEKEKADKAKAEKNIQPKSESKTEPKIEVKKEDPKPTPQAEPKKEQPKKEEKPEPEEISLYNINVPDDLKNKMKLNPVQTKTEINKTVLNPIISKNEVLTKINRILETPIIDDLKMSYTSTGLQQDVFDSTNVDKIKQDMENNLQITKKNSEQLANKYSQLQLDKEKKLQEYRDMVLKLNREKRNVNKAKEVEPNNADSALSDELKKKLEMRKNLAEQLKNR